MKLFNFKIITRADRWLFNSSTIAGALWLFIVFALRKIFLYYQIDTFVLGFLPNFFAAFGFYCLSYLRFKSKLLAIILSFALLTMAEIMQLFTPRTFDPLDIVATVFGIGTALLFQRILEK